VMMVFAVVGYFMRKLDFSFATFIIGFALGKTFEQSIRQSVILFKDRPLDLLGHPIVLGFVVLTLSPSGASCGQMSATARRR
jgi:putative tricarboxylic transport membrane protein